MLWSRRSGRVRVGLGAAVLAAAVPLVALAAQSADWPSGGQNLGNTHSNDAENHLNPNQVRQLDVRWTAQVHGDVSATAAVVGGAVYVPDWGGYLNKLNADTGAVIWSKPISTYDGIPGSVSRTSPAVVGNTVYVGDQNGAHLMAVNAADGSPRWTTQVDAHPFAILTAGALVADGVIYQGVSSLEEGVAANPAYPCCTFRGSVVAVNAATGAIIWQTYTVPDNGGAPGGYSGGAVWGTTAALDRASNTLFITTGNNYEVPASVKTCQAGAATPADENLCLAADDHVDAIMALNPTNGAIRWATGVQTGLDDWNVACIVNVPPPNNCPVDAGPDFDFGSGPNLFTVPDGRKGSKLVVGAGQKSGQYWALDAANGHVLWSAAPGPGSTLGGIEWGPATDGQRIYVAEANFGGIPHTTAGGQTITSGSWAALDPATGKVLWQTVDPSHNAFGGGQDIGPLAVANGVVYAPSMSGTMRALDAGSGKVLWQYDAQGSVNAGAAVSDGTVYWGSGYTHLGIPGWTGSTTFYAFSRQGQ